MLNEIILIAAVTVDGFIARHKKEKIQWSQDLFLFKKQTMGHPIIMGSNTHETLGMELKGRDIIVVHRDDNPKTILGRINKSRCFVIGGGRTNSRFSSFLTHLYITPHPLVFGKGVPLFASGTPELKLYFQKLVPVSLENGIYQFQYTVDP